MKFDHQTSVTSLKHLNQHYNANIHMMSSVFAVECCYYNILTTFYTGNYNSVSDYECDSNYHVYGTSEDEDDDE